jgi:hypothetical protein
VIGAGSLGGNAVADWFIVAPTTTSKPESQRLDVYVMGISNPLLVLKEQQHRFHK